MKRDAYDPRFTGFLFTDATHHEGCSKCSAKAGEQCKQPSGRESSKPHHERTKALTDRFGHSFWSARA